MVNEVIAALSMRKLLPFSCIEPIEAVRENDDVADGVDPSFFPFVAFAADDAAVVFDGTSNECGFGKRANGSIDGNIRLLSNCK